MKITTVILWGVAIFVGLAVMRDGLEVTINRFVNRATGAPDPTVGDEFLGPIGRA